MIKFARFENESIKRYEFHSYESLEEWIFKQIENFKSINRVYDEDNDYSFIQFNEQMQTIKNMWKVNKGQVDDLKCNSCSEKDHEEVFCRCEDRNIKLAKELRTKNILQPERLNPEDILTDVCDSPNSEYK
jgi:hypothetical protein